jgi:hypothetical protein
VQADTQIVDRLAADVPGSFVNAGTLRKSSGTGTTYFGNSSAFTNTGTVEVQQGMLDLRGGGTSSGGFNVDAGATLMFNSNYTLDDSAMVSGAGNVSFLSSTVTVAGGYQVTGVTTVNGGTVAFSSTDLLTIPTLVLSRGMLTGMSYLTVTGTLTWTGTSRWPVQALRPSPLEQP